ncbi:MAG: diacylglycerol kinase family protein [Pseudomonadales bacterium]
MARVAVISNPHASRRRSEALLRDLQRAANVEWHSTDSAAEADALIANLPEDVELLVLDGGDGTVQRALTALLHERESPVPKIAILPSGSTNMSAFDISGRRSWHESAAELLRLTKRDASEWPRAARPVIRLRSPGAERPICGMFFGTGVIVQGIEYCHDWIYRLGIRREWAPGFALLRAVWGVARREAAFSAGVSLTIAVEDEPEFELCATLLMVSALDRLFLGLTPFWGTGDGALHFTLVRQGAKAFLRSLPNILRGRETPRTTPAGGYWSENLNRVRLTLGGPYTIDGEIFPAPEGGALQLEATPPVEFVRLAFRR